MLTLYIGLRNCHLVRYQFNMISNPSSHAIKLKPSNVQTRCPSADNPGRRYDGPMPLDDAITLANTTVLDSLNITKCKCLLMYIIEENDSSFRPLFRDVLVPLRII